MRHEPGVSRREIVFSTKCVPLQLPADLYTSHFADKWELSISQLVPGAGVYDILENDTWCLQHARMEAHYESNGAFLEEGQLLKPENIAKIKHIPCAYKRY